MLYLPFQIHVCIIPKEIERVHEQRNKEGSKPMLLCSFNQSTEGHGETHNFVELSLILNDIS